jgi:hypothetical protein
MENKNIIFWSGAPGNDRLKIADLFSEKDGGFSDKNWIVTTSNTGRFGINYYAEIQAPSKEKIKEFISGINKKDMLNILDDIASILNWSDEGDKGWGGIFAGFLKDNDIYRAIFKGDTRLTVDEILEITGLDISEIPKTFWRGTLQDLNLVKSSRNYLIQLMKDDRADIFRIIGKRTEVQFTKDELKEIVLLPSFIKVTRSGLIGSVGDTADIVNRRAVLFYQDACDDEIVLDMLNSFNSTVDKESFMKSLKRKSIVEKYKDSPVVQLLTKLT